MVDLYADLLRMRRLLILQWTMLATKTNTRWRKPGGKTTVAPSGSALNNDYMI